MMRQLLSTIIGHRLKGLLHKSGVFSASKKVIETGYNKAWMRDNIYQSLGLEAMDDKDSLKRLYQRIFDYLIRHEHKIDAAIEKKPDHKNDYIHPRFCPLTLREFDEDWGNKQNDMIGSFLFKVGDLEKKDLHIIRNGKDLEIVQKLVHYLASIEYWHDEDNGVWEENEEVHASSVGACVAGLRSVSHLVEIPDWLIQHGQDTLDRLLPHESTTKYVDLALLSLIYPFNVVSKEQRDAILRNVENHLVRNRGVIRYYNDAYYSNGFEAEWCFGFPWLAKIHKDLGNTAKYRHYMRKTYSVMRPNGDIPELYLGQTKEHNHNTPLGWTHALSLVALSRSM